MCPTLLLVDCRTTTASIVLKNSSLVGSRSLTYLSNITISRFMQLSVFEFQSDELLQSLLFITGQAANGHLIFCISYQTDFNILRVSSVRLNKVANTPLDAIESVHDQVFLFSSVHLVENRCGYPCS